MYVRKSLNAFLFKYLRVISQYLHLLDNKRPLSNIPHNGIPTHQLGGLNSFITRCAKLAKTYHNILSSNPGQTRFLLY